ncbi:MAG: type II secretion system F family protein [Elusimicrobia bacterium]|nr:type II secretion system F family protein [Elusimicrobiota bacterium]
MKRTGCRLLAGFFVLATSYWLLATSSFAGIFSDDQMDRILCAQKRMQLFYYYLTPDRDPQIARYPLECPKGVKETIVMPEWIGKVLPNMVGRSVWQDPQEGILHEAQLWQAPISVLYEFFEITKRTFPPEKEGSGIVPGLLVKEYADSRVRFQMSLDRLYRSRLGDSLGGRGRSLLATLDLILKEMESIADAISSTKPTAYAQAVSAISTLSDRTFYQLMSPPRGLQLPNTPKPVFGMFSLALKGLGTLLMALAFLKLGNINQEKISQFIQDYMTRRSKYAEEFNRQFIQVKVQYLLLAPFILFSLMGLLTFNLFGILIFSSVGLYLGLKAPEWVLNYVREKRGKQIEGQLMDALILMGNALKSGLDIVQAFEMVHRDLLPPISDEFGLVIRNYQLGTPFEKALEGLEERIASRLLSYMVKAIVIQRQVGGNLTKIFDRIIENIREEGKLEEKTKSLTAQQRIQSIVVGVMPWIMLAIMFMFQGATMAKFYFSPIGMLVLFFCAIWIAIGMKIVSSLGNIRV